MNLTAPCLEWQGKRLMARRYSVSQAVISEVVTRRTWAHVPDLEAV